MREMLIRLTAILFMLSAGGCNNQNVLKSSVNDHIAIATTESISTTERTLSEDEALPNIAVEAVPQTDGGYLAVFITNKNAETVDYLELTVDFYDANGIIVSSETDTQDLILPDSTVLSPIVCPTDYSKFEYHLSAEPNKYPNYCNRLPELDIKQKRSSYGETVSITNLSDRTVDVIEFIPVFYDKNNGIIRACSEYPITNLGVMETFEQNCMFFGSYDHTEIYVNRAHSLNQPKQ